MPLLFSHAEMPYPAVDTDNEGVIASRRMFVARYLLSAIAHPQTDDESAWQRRGFVASYVPGDLESLWSMLEKGEITLGIPGDATARMREFSAHFIENHLGPLGDRFTLWKSMTREQHLAAYQEGAQAIYLIGRALILLRTLASHHQHQLRRGAGISKALEVAADDDKTSRRRAWHLWSKYKSVAHIMAAFVYLGRTHNLDGPAADDSIFAYLIVASDFQRFMLTFKAQQVDKPLAATDDLLLVPDHGDETVCKFQPLSEKDLAVVKARFA